MEDIDKLLDDILGTASGAAPKPAAPAPLPKPKVEADPLAEAVNAAKAEAPASVITETPAPAPSKAPAPAKAPQLTATVNPEPKPLPPVQPDDDDTPAPLPRVTAPTFTTDELAESIDLRSYAMLVKLSMSQWRATVKDKKSSQLAAQAQAADDRAFRTYKDLLAGADAKLKEVNAVLNKAAGIHYKMTLPWSTAGTDDQRRRRGERVLPNDLLFDYTRELGQLKQEMKAKVQELVAEYPSMVQAAQKHLGSAFNPAEYPDVSEVAGQFRMDFDFMPIPQGDGFKNINDQMLEKLTSDLNRKTRQMLENAMRDLWDRFEEVLRHVHDRMTARDPDGNPVRFHSTLMDKVNDLVEHGTYMNLTGDATIERVRLVMKKEIANHTVEQLRNEIPARARVAKAAEKALNMMAKGPGGK